MSTKHSKTRPDAAIRALFLDLDGTLVDADSLVSPAVSSAVRRARDHGCEVVICTGRTRFRTTPVAAQVGPPLGYAITSNGGVLSHLGTGEVIYRHLLEVEVAVAVVRTLCEAGADPFVYEDSDRDGIEGARVLYHPDAEQKEWYQGDARYRPHASLTSDLPFNPVSVSAYGEGDLIRPLAAVLRSKYSDRLSIVESGTEYAWGVEIYVKGVDKRLGLETLAARLDVAQHEIMAIGDHINDIEMLQWAGWGVAMGNAQPEVIAVSDWITDDLRADGVARAIEQFILP